MMSDPAVSTFLKHFEALRKAPLEAITTTADAAHARLVLLSIAAQLSVNIAMADMLVDAAEVSEEGQNRLNAALQAQAGLADDLTVMLDAFKTRGAARE